MTDAAALPEESLPLECDLRIDAACQAFEAAWQVAVRGGPRPGIEDYLAGVAATERWPLLRELLKVELHYRRGEHPSAEEYRRRFPEHGHRLAQMFDPGPVPDGRAGGAKAGCDTTGSAIPPDDPAEFAVLDAYVEELHGGRRPDRDRLLRARPELAGLLDWLDSLDRLDPGPPTLPPPADGPAPAGFGKYELLGELGRGGMGVVYRARQTDLDRTVAVKMILGSHLASEEQIARFQAEARVAARLSHPHIVQVYEAGTVHGQPYFAMQYVEGRGLDEVLRDGSLPTVEAVRLLAAVARAVAYLHAEGLIHRDLKPSNVLIDRVGRPYLTDFGLARLLERESSLTASGAIVGTPSYMAPEQAAGGKDVGPRSDIYGLGAILYELLTGRPPFREATPLDTVVQVLEGEPTLPRRLNPRLPRELELICLQCLEKVPERRYPSASALADDLERFLAGEAVEARPRRPWQRLQRWARREPALASRLGGLAVFAAVIQANYHIAGHSQPAVHFAVLAVVALWALASWGCQRLLGRRRGAGVVRYLWAGGEPFLLTALLTLTGNEAGPLLIVYAVLVAAAGLWFSVRLVWFTTAMAELAFGFLVVSAEKLRAEPHHAVVFVACLAVVGLVVAHQVQRARVLGRHYEHRPPP
jgi:serine/threonine-protein kinase